MKMKRILLFMLFTVLFLGILGQVYTGKALAETENSSETSDFKFPRLSDVAGILSESEAAELFSDLEEISERQNCDVIIMTVDGKTTEDDIQGFADHLLNKSFDRPDGILFLVDVTERHWAISTKGLAMKIFSESVLDDMEDKVVSRLRDNEFNKACFEFAKLSDKYITEYHSFFKPKIAGIALLIALIISGIVIAVLLGQLKSVAPERAASRYVVDGSFVLDDSGDFFLYRTVSKTRRSTESSGGSSGSRSNSSSSNGGRSGSF